MIHLVNTFSINMLPRSAYAMQLVPISAHAVREMLTSEPWQSAVSDPDTARIVSDALGIEVPVNRVNLSLKLNDELIVAQYTGPRPAAGSSGLPAGAEIEFWIVGQM